MSLPANSIVDLTTLSLYGLVTVTAGTGGKVVPPANVESLIDSVYWTANGTQITNSFPMYSVLANAFLDWQGGDKINMRKVLQLAAPITATPTVTAAAQEVCWNNWLGLPSTATTKMIDTSAIGDLRLHIRFAPNLVLATDANNATAPTYTVTNIYAMIDCISVDDGGLYQSLLQKRLESGPLEIAFTDFYTFNMGTQTGAFTGRFSVASSSLDAVHCTA